MFAVNTQKWIRLLSKPAPDTVIGDPPLAGPLETSLRAHAEANRKIIESLMTPRTVILFRRKVKSQSLAFLVSAGTVQVIVVCDVGVVGRDATISSPESKTHE
jgi:hypothetical protein